MPFHNQIHDLHGISGCALSFTGVLYYIVVPMTFMQVFNLVCFIRTSVALCCGFWSKHSESTFQTRAQSVVKIFVATGICWVAESIGLLAHSLAPEESQTIIVKTTFILDLINTLQGLTLFLALLSNHLTFNNKCIDCLERRNQKRDRKRTYNLELDTLQHANRANVEPTFKQTSFNEC